MFQAAFVSLLLPLLALASPQIYGPPPPVNDPTTAVAAAAPSAPPSTSTQMNVSYTSKTMAQIFLTQPVLLQVNVGANGQFIFSPNNLTAPNGTLITFFFPS